MRLSFVAPTIISAFFAVTINGQISSNVTCSVESSWMVNKLGQTPCLVSAYLSSVCNNGIWNVPTLTAQGPYNPPSGTGVTPCRCNSVVYALISACSLCQGGLVGPFDDWIQNCPVINVTRGGYPRTVPSTTQVPAWSLVDPSTTGGIWNATQARQIADDEKSSNKKPNIGIIVGGVLGGIGGLAVIIFIIWYFMPSRQSKPDKVVPVTRSRRPSVLVTGSAASFMVEYPQGRDPPLDLAGSPSQNITHHSMHPQFAPGYQIAPYISNSPSYPSSAHPSIPTTYTGGRSSLNHDADVSILSHPTRGTISPPPPPSSFLGYPAFAQPPAYAAQHHPAGRYSGAAEV